MSGVLKTLVYSQEYAKPIDETTAVTMALTHDTVIGNPGKIAKLIPAMQAANPKVQVLAYLNGVYGGGSPGDYPEGWYIKGADGKHCVSKNFGNNLMDPRNPDWIASRVSEARKIHGDPFDGIMLDMLGTASIGRGYCNNLPIDSKTNAPWTEKDWLSATANIAKAVKAATGKYVMANGLGGGPRYFDKAAPTSILFDGADAGLSEAWMRFKVGSTPNLAQWRQAVDSLADAEKRGKTNAVAVKIWNESATIEQKNRWHGFALASFLLGAGGLSAFNCTYAIDQALVANLWWTVDLGLPTDDYAAVEGTSLFQRGFERGTVIVNPSKDLQVVDNPASTYLYLGESGVISPPVQSITLAPVSGMIAVLAT